MGSKGFFASIAGARGDVDMTEGSISRHILAFAFPLLLGNLFQQFYNTVDAWVVGNYVSNEAFSAVGAVGPIINTLIGFFSGLATGAGVVISQYYGAGEHRRVGHAVHTALILTAGLGVVFTAVGILITPAMITLMKTPEEAIPEATAYLTVCFAGIFGLMIYNMGAGILRAVGDSQRPFLFLVISAVVNTGLDLLFVLRFGMGVEGVAYATILSQGISAVLVILTLATAKNCIRFSFRTLRVTPPVLRQIVRIGMPAALQLAVTNFSNIFVQSYINDFGTNCMSGWTAYAKIDQLLLLPMQAISLGVTTFVGQNLGKGDEPRAKRGVRVGLVFSILSALILMAPVMIFAPSLVAFFNDKTEVVEYGALFLRWISPFYVLCCVNQIYAGALRGAGDSRAPMFFMLGSFVLFRQIYLFVFSRVLPGEILPVVLGYPAGWLLCSSIFVIYYRRSHLLKKRIVAPRTGE